MARDEGYLEAESRIEEARKAGAIELYLNSLKLTEVPETMASLTQIIKLNLSYNQLTELPEAIAFPIPQIYLSKLELTADCLHKISPA